MFSFFIICALLDDHNRDLSSNQITGEFPVAVTKMVNIQELYVLPVVGCLFGVKRE